jgi:hypothetical protein
MTQHHENGWRTYLPDYSLPSSVRNCLSCFGLILIGGAIFVFLILPSLTAYLIEAASS